jgi:hypothetical protein
MARDNSCFLISLYLTSSRTPYFEQDVTMPISPKTLSNIFIQLHSNISEKRLKYIILKFCCSTIINIII